MSPPLAVPFQSILTYGDSDFVQYLCHWFHRHFVGKTLRNVCYSDVTKIRFVGRPIGYIEIFLN